MATSNFVAPSVTLSKTKKVNGPKVINIADGSHIMVKKIAGKIESGKIKGRLLVHLPMKQPATVKTWIIMEDVPFQPLETTFLSEENIKERLITGNVSVRGMVAVSYTHLTLPTT